MKNSEENKVMAEELNDEEIGSAAGGIDTIPASKQCSNPNCPMHGKTKSYPKHAKVCRYCGQPTLTDKYSNFDKQWDKGL